MKARRLIKRTAPKYYVCTVYDDDKLLFKKCGNSGYRWDEEFKAWTSCSDFCGCGRYVSEQEAKAIFPAVAFL